MMIYLHCSGVQLRRRETVITRNLFLLPQLPGLYKRTKPASYLALPSHRRHGERHDRRSSSERRSPENKTTYVRTRVSVRLCRQHLGTADTEPGVVVHGSATAESVHPAELSAQLLHLLRHEPAVSRRVPRAVLPLLRRRRRGRRPARRHQHRRRHRLRVGRPQRHRRRRRTCQSSPDHTQTHVRCLPAFVCSVRWVRKIFGGDCRSNTPPRKSSSPEHSS